MTDKTPHIKLRPFEPDDARSLFEHLNHPQAIGRRELPWGIPDDSLLSLAQIDEILKKWADRENKIRFAIADPGRDQVLGHIGASWTWDPHCPHIGLLIFPEYEGQGLEKLALSLVLEWVFGNLPAHNISTWIPDWDSGTIDFFKREGFQLAGSSRREAVHRGRFMDYILLDILRPEWEKLHSGEFDAA